MSLYPKNKGRFYISDVVADPVYNPSGRRVFQGFGSDYSAANDNIVYISSIPLERTVPLKGFVDSIKLNLQKEVEKVTTVDSQVTIVKEYTTDLSYDIKINMPAHSTNEAANNLAKMEELQRLIMPVKASGTGDAIAGVAVRTKVKKNLFSVWFKNLINNGYPSANKSLPPGSEDQFKELLDRGFVCYIEEINYEPDLTAGFFENGGELLPKNIILSLKLNYDSNSIRHYNEKSTLEPFMANGHYEEGDTSLFPFGVTVRGAAGYIERPVDIAVDKQEFTQKQMNDIFSKESISSYLFVSLPIEENTGTSPSLKGVEGATAEAVVEDAKNKMEAFYKDGKNKRRRYVLLKPFFENFTRGTSVTVTTSQEKGNSIYKEVTIGNSSLNHLAYDMTLVLPANNLSEAKKNCAKIQYLTRIFLRRKALTTGSTPKRKHGSGISMKEALDNSLKRDQELRRVMVYIPNKIENPNSKGVPRTFATMYANSIPLFFEKFDININMEDGFFEEGNRLFPKSMSIAFTFLEVDNNLMSTIQMVGNKSSDGYRLVNSGDQMETAELELFPFNKKTSKIKIGDS